MSENINFNYNNLTPFKWYIIENFPFLEDSIDGPTNYTLLSKLGDEINKNRDAINSIGMNAEELTNAFNSLKNYVDNYFDNLDVQSEVNQKLDIMATNGTLEALIGAYIQPRINEQNELINERLSSQDNTLNNQNVKINQIENKVDSVSSGSPLVATSTGEMTDTTRVYVNTTDGKWYYYDGDSWEIGGTYQSTSFGDDNIVSNNIKNIETNKVKATLLDLDVGDFTLWNSQTAGTIISNADGSITYNKTQSGQTGIQLTVPKSLAGQEDLLFVFDVISYTGNINPSIYLNYPTVKQLKPCNIGTNYIYAKSTSNTGASTNRQTIIIATSEIANLTIADLRVYKGSQLSNYFEKNLYNTLDTYLNYQEYKNYNDYHKNELDKEDTELGPWNKPTLFKIEDNNIKFGTNKQCGFELRNRQQTTGTLNFSFDAELNNCTNFRVHITNPEISIFYWSAPVSEGHNDIYVDLTNLEIYHDLQAPYKIVFGGTLPSTATISNLKIFISDIFSSELYDSNFEKMMFNIFNKLNSGSLVNNVILKSPNGTNYEVKVANNGDLYTIGTTINKALFIGNSLLVGFGTHGMASYSVNDDYYAYINSYLLEKNENYTASKISGVTVETATSTTTANNYVNNSIIPLMDSSTNLVIIQLGDNTANNTTAVSLYKQNITYLIEKLREVNENVKILLVGCWYNASTMIPIMTETADENGITLVNISALNTSINQNHIGATYIDSQGKTQTITSEGVASHPSSTGMKAIANLIEQYI